MRETPEYKFLVDGLKRNYKECSKKTTIGFNEFSSYRDTGLRELSDGAYFEREKYFNSCLFLSLIYPENENYINELQEIIWAVCNDFTWERAAHMEHMEDIEFQEIALGGCAMAAKLAKAKLWLGERLDPIIRERIHAEIKRRYLIPYGNHTWRWEVTKCNWAATCAGYMGIAFMLEFPEEFLKIKPKLESALEYFLDSFSKEGVCLEGVGYWAAVAQFCLYANCLLEFTNGKENYFKEERVHKIGQFLNNSYLRGNFCVAFSDCYPQTKTKVGISHMLHSLYPDIELLPDYCYGLGDEEIDHMIKWWDSLEITMLYFNPQYLKNSPVKSNEESTYFAPDAGWYIYKGEKYSLAAKGGHNDEPHNHNDIGSFHLVTDSGQQLADFGPSLYTGKNFDDNYRYDIFANSSFGHSLPIIDDMGQKNGREFEGEISLLEEGVLIQASKAYGNPELSSFERKLKCEKENVRLFDSFEFGSSTHKITERFVSWLKPEIKNGVVYLGNISLVVKSDEWISEIKEFEHISNFNITGEKSKVYAVDFTRKCETFCEFEMEILIN